MNDEYGITKTKPKGWQVLRQPDGRVFVLCDGVVRFVTWDEAKAVSFARASVPHSNPVTDFPIDCI